MLWERQVGRVFNTRPRIGTNKGTLWMARQHEERAFSDAFSQPGDHLCVDGPSGSGKSSLVLTHLARQQTLHAMVQVTKSMDWSSFCSLLTEPPTPQTRTMEANVEVGVENALPSGKFRVSLGKQTETGLDAQRRFDAARTWSEHDLCRRLQEENAVLVVDDVERASDELLTRLSDAAKILIQSYPAEHAKIVFVGAGGVLRRLFAANQSLIERVAHVSVGAFPSPNDSWRFLTLGFEKLGMPHPGNSGIPRQRQQAGACIEACYDAADGLPKSLNKLGQIVALESSENHNANAGGIIGAAKRMAQEHWMYYSRELPDVIECLRSSPAAVEVVKVLCAHGMGGIHDVHALAHKVAGASTPDDELTVAQIAHAVNGLVDAGFLEQSGLASELVFATEPAAAHTLGVAMRKPELFPGALDLLQGIQQLQLPFDCLIDQPVGRG